MGIGEDICDIVGTGELIGGKEGDWDDFTLILDAEDTPAVLSSGRIPQSRRISARSSPDLVLAVALVEFKFLLSKLAVDIVLLAPSTVSGSFDGADVVIVELFWVFCRPGGLIELEASVF